VLPSLVKLPETVPIVELGCGSSLPVLCSVLSGNDKLRAVAKDISTTHISMAEENLKDY
jgi:methylase of polypeptide subunit release factors